MKLYESIFLILASKRVFFSFWGFKWGIKIRWKNFVPKWKKVTSQGGNKILGLHGKNQTSSSKEDWETQK